MSTKGTMSFEVDWPALYRELCSSANLRQIGPGGAMGLSVLSMELCNIGNIALKHGDKEILERLSRLGMKPGMELHL